MIKWLYRKLTGTPWTTTRSMAAEFGPTLATRYPELLQYSDLELVRRDRDELLAEIEAGRRGGLISIETAIAARRGSPYSTRRAAR